MRAPDLTILIPLYNEEQTLIPGVRQLLLYLERVGLYPEVLLGCNGSTDATALVGSMLESALPERIRFFRIPSRGHLGQVFKIASSMARSPFLISVDVDMAVDPAFIPQALELLKEYHIVVGSKLSGSQQRSAMRNAGTELYVLATQMLLGLPFDDYSPGAKGYRIDSVKPLLPEISKDTGYVLDILCQAGRNGLEVVTVPVVCHDFRKSRFRLLELGIGRFLHLIRVWAKDFACRPEFGKIKSENGTHG